jgi:diguanylate cyclase (GGDEF)-like protein
MSPRRFFSSLGGRIVLLFLGLLLGVQGFGFLRLSNGIDRNARTQLAQGLERSEAVLRDELAQRGELLAAGAATLGADFGLLSTLQGEPDADTVRSTLEDKIGRLKSASVVAVLDRQGGLLAATGEGAAGVANVAADAAAWPPRQPRIVLLAGAPLQMVKVPVAQRGEAPSGWLLVGSAMARSLPDLARLTQAQLSLVAAPPGQAAQIVASTLQAGGVAMPAASLAPLARLAEGPGELALAGDDTELRSAMLGEGPAVRVVLSLSVDDAVRPYARLQRELALVTLFGVAVFAAGSVLMARSVTRPVQSLVQASRRLGGGDFDTPVPAAPRNDELAELAQAFEGMRAGLAERTEHIRQLAYWDPLTRLPNRAQFEDRLRQTLAEAGVATVLMLNLDRLEQVNQVLGRARGDRLLQCAADRLRAVLRRLGELPVCVDGLVARLTGDEFALLLPGCDAARGAEVAREVAQAFEQPVTLDDSVVDLSAGMGVAQFPTHADSADALMARALLAMTEAKRRMAGMLVYDPSIDAGSAQTLSLLGELRRALRQQELRLFLQPKVAVADGTLAGAEALVRWQHPERGLVPPVQFIPFAEETGFIHELTLWVVDEAARIWATQAAQGFELLLSVNLSAHDLMKPDLLARLDARLQHHRVPARALCLEITESAIAHDPQRALQMLHALKAHGFKLSIDDFGAGQTSLAQLIDLPVDELKLDMLFVRTMDKDADKASMVGSLIRMGHDRRLSVVAEGVENATILQQLRELGCDQAQGWHLGKPMPAGELPAWARQRWPAPASVVQLA